MKRGPHSDAFVFVCLAWGSLVAAQALAQSWTGDSGVSISVQAHGKPVAGAEITLKYLGMTPPDGPATLRTSSKGRVAVRGLASGQWRLNVQHPEFMSYLAVIEIIRGKKADVLSATLQKTGTSLVPLRVKLGKADGNAVLARPTKADPGAAVTPEPVASPVTTPLPTPTTVPAAPPKVEPPPEMVPTVSTEPAEPPVTVPQSPPPAVPAIPMEPAPSVALFPRVTTRLRSFDDRTCPECKPGEWALSVEQRAGGVNDGPCPGDHQTATESVVQTVLASAGAELRKFAGALLGGVKPGAIDYLPPVARPAVTAKATQLADPSSACQSIIAFLPKGARFVGYRYEVRDRQGEGDCLGNQECGIGNARWLGNPIIRRTPEATVVYGIFLNEADLRRSAQLTVYFDPVRGWNP